MYRAVNLLDDFFKKYQEKVLKEENREITITEIMKEIGEFAGVSWATVKHFKNKNMQPSLAVAMRIAEFFNAKVEDIWTVEKIDDKLYSDKSNRKKETKKKKEVKICKMENCKNKAIARGMCNKHYQQERNKNKELFKRRTVETCTVDGCDNPHHARSLCTYHYNRQYHEKRMERYERL